MSKNTIFNFNIYYKYNNLKMNIKYNLTKLQEDFISINYPKFGSKYCQNKLGIEIKSIMSIVSKLRLKRNHITKIEVNLDNKYFCYILGIIWADGSICKKTNKVSISLVEEDMLVIKYIFDKVGIWNTSYHNNTKRNYKNQLSLNISDTAFKKFLSENDFLDKSSISPDKIIKKIPISNLKYFIRGIVDGDGCFYFNKKKYCRQLTISSSIEQDWSYLFKISEYMDIKCSSYKRISKKSSYSIFRITNKDIIKFGNYIYEDFFGLVRKYNKFKLIKNSYIDNPYSNRKVRSKKVTINGTEFDSMTKAASFFSINRNMLRKKLKNGYYISNYKDVEMTYINL